MDIFLISDFTELYPTERLIDEGAAFVGCYTFALLRECSNILENCPKICDAMESLCSATGNKTNVAEVCNPTIIALSENSFQRNVFPVSDTAAVDAKRVLISVGEDMKHIFEYMRKRRENADVRKSTEAGDECVDIAANSATKYNVGTFVVMTLLSMLLNLLLNL